MTISSFQSQTQDRRRKALPRVEDCDKMTLRQVMEKRGIKSQDLAKTLGVSNSAVLMWMKGWRIPFDFNQEKLHKVLRVELNYFPEPDPEKPRPVRRVAVPVPVPGERTLNDVMTARKLKNVDMVRATGLSKTFFSNTRRGMEVPSRKNRQILDNFFGMPLHYGLVTNESLTGAPPVEDPVPSPGFPSNLAQTIGQQIRRLRTERRLTQADLGHRIGRSANYIGNCERGESEVHWADLEKIATLYGVAPAWFLGGEEGGSTPPQAPSQAPSQASSQASVVASPDLETAVREVFKKWLLGLVMGCLSGLTSSP